MLDAPITLIVETPQGVLVREVRAASPLSESLPHGEAAEVAAEDAAAVWGMPDFVCRPEVQRTGSGTREIGDRLLLADDVGVVVQVKARTSPSGNEEKEVSWLRKNIAKGIRQGDGTIRRLKNGQAAVRNARGALLALNGDGRQWITAVVVDHPELPEDFVPSLAANNPAVVLTRRDWEFLFQQLKSTHAVMSYLKRVSGEEQALGTESARYFQLALADHEVEPAPVPDHLSGLGVPETTPIVPLREVGAADFGPQLLFRSLMEDIAISDPGVSDDDRVNLLAALDRLHVSHRGMISTWLMEELSKVTATTEGSEWRFRRLESMTADGRTYALGFAVAALPFDAASPLFQTWLLLRHHEMRAQAPNPDSLTSAGLLLTPRGEGDRPFDTTFAMFSGELHLTEEQIADWTRLWNTRAGAATAPVFKKPHGLLSRQKVGRNDSCPCGSRKKFKKCCGR